MPKATSRNLEQKIKWLTTLYSITKDISATLELKQCLKKIVNAATKLLNVERVSLMLFDRRKKELTIECAEGLSPYVIQKARVKIGSGVSGWVAKYGKPLLINDIQKDPRFRSRNKGYTTRSLLSVPLKTAGEVIGVLNVNNKRKKQVFSKDDLDLLTTLANEAAIAISQARLYENLLDANERLKELDKLKSDFVANVSHELSTPLATCRYFVNILLKSIPGAISDKQREYLGLIEDNIGRLTHLINNLLSLSRIESGKIVLKREPVEVAALVKEVFNNFKGQLKQKGLAMECNISKSLPAVYIDREKIVEVLTNLLNNAIKFTSHGKIGICAEGFKNFVAISVSDTGTGIAPEDQERIFDKFQQAKHKRPDVKGTGLGLAISRDIVILHKGTLTVESHIGKGSKFTFTLPIYDSDVFFAERVQEEIIKAKKSESSLSLVILSLHNFTRIKKSIAPAAVSKLLLDMVETIIKKTVRRPSDIVIRFKEGKILAILAGADNKGATSLIKRIKKAIAEHRFVFKGAKFNILVKYGTATYPKDGVEADLLVNKAQKALKAKEKRK